MSARTVQIVGAEDGSGQRLIVGVSPLTKNLGVAPSIERELEQGQVFAAQLFSSIGANNALEFLIRIDPVQDMGVRFSGSVNVANEALLTFFSAPTTSADGAAILVGPANFVTAKVASTLVFKGPTITADGVGGEGIFLPAGKASSIGVGGELSTAILSPGDFLVRIQDLSGQANDMSVLVIMVEYDL